MMTHSSELPPIHLNDGRTTRARLVRNSDADLFLTFFAGLSTKSRDFMHGWNTATSCTPEHAARIAASADSPDYRGLVILDGEPPNERVIGHSGIQGIGATGTIPMLGIGVIDEYHGAGLGTALMQLMTDQARSLGVDQVQLGVFTENERAIHVYESVGYRIDPALRPKDVDGRTEVYMVVATARGESIQQ